MHCSWVESAADFAALGGLWEELIRKAGRRSLFFSHEWLDAAWSWARLEGHPQVLLVGEGRAADGAAALLLRDARIAGMPWRVLQWLEIPDTQECELIAGAGAEDAAARIFLQELVARRTSWDKLQLSKLQPESLVLTVFRGLLERRGLTHYVRQTDSNPYVSLDGGWAAYQSSLSRSFKKKLNLARNRMAKLGEVEVSCVGGDESTPAAMEAAAAALADVSARSWKQQTATTLDHEGPGTFVRRLAARFGATGPLRIWLLRLDDRVVATELQLHEQGRTYALRADFVPELGDASPGTNLSVEILKRLFEAEPGGRYLMGPGANAYKLRWTERSVPLHELTVYSPTARGRALHGLEQKLRPLARALRDRFRKASLAPSAPSKDDD